MRFPILSSLMGSTGSPFKMPGEFALFKGDDLVTSGTDVTQVTNQLSSSHLSSAAATPKPQFVDGPFVDGWSFATGAFLTVDLPAPVVMTSGAIFIVCRTSHVGVAYECFVSLGLTSLVDTEVSILDFQGVTGMLGRRKSSTGLGDIDIGGIGNADHGVCITWDSSNAYILIDEVLVGTSTVDVAVGSIQRITLGVYSNLTSNRANGLVQSEVRFGNQLLDESARAKLFRYARQEHGIL